MRLLHVIHSLNPHTGGPAEAVKIFTQHPLDSQQSVLTLDHSTDPWINDVNAPVHSVGLGRGKYGYTRQAAHWLNANIAKYDAAIIHGCWQFHGVATHMAARRAKVPYFVFPHGMLDRYFETSSRLKHWKKRLYWPVERSILQGADAVLFTAMEERQRASRQFAFRSRDQIVPLGTERPRDPADQARETFLQRFPELRGKRILLFLGRLHSKKGVDLLIRAFGSAQKPTDSHLVIAGPAHTPETDASLRELASQCGCAERITFTGMLAGILKTGAFASAEGFILPSHQENFGIAVAEALASGIPVLVSDQVNIWREIQEDGAGLVAPDTQAGVNELLSQWFALSELEREQMRSAAARCYESRFRADAASEMLLRTLRDCGVGGVPSNEQSSARLQSAHA
jgi:glycosyltransferase involved in cell wall biosynthesis